MSLVVKSKLKESVPGFNVAGDLFFISKQDSLLAFATTDMVAYLDASPDKQVSAKK